MLLWICYMKIRSMFPYENLNSVADAPRLSICHQRLTPGTWRASPMSHRNLNMCTETWHFTASTRGRMHLKRNSSESFIEFTRWKKAMQLMKYSFSSPAWRLILTSSTSNITQAYTVEWQVIEVGTLSVIGLGSCRGYLKDGFKHRN